MLKIIISGIKMSIGKFFTTISSIMIKNSMLILSQSLPLQLIKHSGRYQPKRLLEDTKSDSVAVQVAALCPQT